MLKKTPYTFDWFLRINFTNWVVSTSKLALDLEHKSIASVGLSKILLFSMFQTILKYKFYSNNFIIKTPYFLYNCHKIPVFTLNFFLFQQFFIRQNTV